MGHNQVKYCRKDLILECLNYSPTRSPFYRECDFTELCYLVGSHELYLKLSLAYQTTASAKMIIGVDLKKKGNMKHNYEKTFYNKVLFLVLTVLPIVVYTRRVG